MSHNIIDPDLHFIIDADSRSITNETGEVLTIMQYDHNSERATFELPRYIEDHDMSKCDLVLVLFANTSKGTSVSARSTSSGVYQVTDLEIKQDETKTLTCSWLISREATQYVGTLKFQIQFVCHKNEETGVPEYYWHTDQCNMINIKPSLSSGNDVVEAYPDIITNMDARLSVLEDNGVPQDRLAAAIDEYLTEHPIEKLTPEELRSAIDAYFVDNPVDQITDEYIEGVIAQYLIDHPVEGEQMTTEEFNSAVEDYISTRPMDSKTEEKVNTLIGEYVQNNQIPGTVTDEALATAINAYFTENPIEASGSNAAPDAVLLNTAFSQSYSTDDMISRYLNKDKSDLTFLRVNGDTFEFVLASDVFGTDTLPDVFWTKDVSTASEDGTLEIINGAPYIDGERVGLTTDDTGYAVTVYAYKETVYRSFTASDIGSTAVSIMDTFGGGSDGDEPLYGKGYITKFYDGLKIGMMSSVGVDHYVMFGENYIDVVGQRKLTNIDVVNNTITITLQGGIQKTLTLTEDGGNITAMTDEDGHVVSISGVTA